MILRLNIRSGKVVELQELLRDAGYWDGSRISGIFGPITESQVKRFQHSKGLIVDGVVGPKTWAALTAAVENKVKPIWDAEDLNEDFSDPEEMLTEDFREAQPTCPNIKELIKLINDAVITRRITRLVFHCTATPQTTTVESILRFWKVNRGWKNPGYHIIIKADGSWTLLQDFNRVTNGVAGINSTSLHVSYIGGIDSKGRGFDNRTDQQKEILETIYTTFKEKLPHITFHGHNEFSNKACPSFNVKQWIDSIA